MTHTPVAASPSAPGARTSLPLRILTAVAVLGVLYLGRSVLVPITLAAMLGFVMAPIVRQIRRLGLNQATAALAALGLVGLTVAGVALAIAMQLSAMSRDLPSYEINLREKIATVHESTVGRLREMQGRAGRLIGDPISGPTTLPSPNRAGSIGWQVHGPADGHVDDAPSDSAVSLSQLAALVWGPLGMVGTVVLVLVFVLLEQDSLRDRLIRLAGGREVRAATSAFNDAGQRLSRYFVSQFAVNFGVGLVIWALLAALNVPHAAVWAALAGVLRFIPYVGFPAAALCACAMAAAMAPGWALVTSTLLVFLGVELLVAHVVEPRLYGHTTGLSPFSVVVAAIFWGALWGPVGLLLSTPLTLCLVVAGRHVPTLNFLDILFGDAPALNLSQRFYQRSLSGDAVEILADARSFLKRRSLAAYCDQVVMPAFELAREDFERKLIDLEQQAAAQHVISQLFAELTHMPRPARGRRTAVLDSIDIGLRLRQDRQQAEGRWQGPLDVPAGSVLLCVSMAGREAMLIAELLARVLRNEHLDARHVTIQELAAPPADAKAEVVGTVFVVGSPADQAVAEDGAVLDQCLAQLTQASLVLVLPMLFTQMPVDQIAADRVHRTAYSFEEAVALVRPAGDRVPL